MQTQICMQIWNIQIQLQQSKYWRNNTLFRQHFGWEVRWGLHDSYQGRSSWQRVVYGKKVIAGFLKWHSSDDRLHYHHECWACWWWTFRWWWSWWWWYVMIVMLVADDDSCHNYDVWIVTMLTNKNLTNSLNLEHAKIKEITSTPF